MAHNIDNPSHPHYIPTQEVPAGTALDLKDPMFHRAQQMVQKGFLTYTAVSAVRTAENPDGTVTDRLTVDRTYNPNPAKK